MARRDGVRLTVGFFFSSRRRHTRSKRDWSSDVCSSDLSARGARYASGFGFWVGVWGLGLKNRTVAIRDWSLVTHHSPLLLRRWPLVTPHTSRSEERRVGKECGAWWVGGRGEEKRA